MSMGRRLLWEGFRFGLGFVAGFVGKGWIDDHVHFTMSSNGKVNRYQMEIELPTFTENKEANRATQASRDKMMTKTTSLSNAARSFSVMPEEVVNADADAGECGAASAAATAATASAAATASTAAIKATAAAKTAATSAAVSNQGVNKGAVKKATSTEAPILALTTETTPTTTKTTPGADSDSGVKRPRRKRSKETIAPVVNTEAVVPAMPTQENERRAASAPTTIKTAAAVAAAATASAAAESQPKRAAATGAVAGGGAGEAASASEMEVWIDVEDIAFRRTKLEQMVMHEETELPRTSS